MQLAVVLTGAVGSRAHELRQSPMVEVRGSGTGTSPSPFDHAGQATESDRCAACRESVEGLLVISSAAPALAVGIWSRCSGMTVRMPPAQVETDLAGWSTPCHLSECPGGCAAKRRSRNFASAASKAV